ncbi:MAG TPA: LLM class flavin-dependent oxidoreductase [Amycolatopsis sp.]|nr:LLM class flavin-dependent oxidoreductase [Amycolatopsis sp.]
MPGPPLAPGSLAVKLQLHDELPVEHRLAELLDQARIADAVGFDGIVLGEHHAGVLPGYVPNPVSVIGWLLARTSAVWGAPCPTLLLPRPTGLAVEELAWLAAAFPGRVAAGFAAGWAEVDFAVTGASRDRLAERFERELVRAASVLTGRAQAPLSGDAAVQRLAERPLPVVSAASSGLACRRAARAGVGVLLDSQIDAAVAGRRVAGYAGAGGTGPRAIVRRIWLGDPPAGLYDRQLALYRGQAERLGIEPGIDAAIVSGEAAEVAGRLADLLRATRASSLILQIHLPGLEAGAARQQLERVGTDLLPRLRTVA